MQNNSGPDSVLGIGIAIGTMILGEGVGKGVGAESSSRDYDILSNKVHLSCLENTIKYITTFV